MAKLKFLIDELFDKKQKHMTHCAIFLFKVELQDGKHYYQGIKLSKYKCSITKASNYRNINV